MRDWPEATLRAWCVGCAASREFPIDWRGRGDTADFREALTCPSCRLNARQRAALGLRLGHHPVQVVALDLVGARRLHPRLRRSDDADHDRGEHDEGKCDGDEQAAVASEYLASLVPGPRD